MDAQQIIIAPGAWMGWPVDLTNVNMIQITLAQLSQTQDYSLRAWVSVYEQGVPLPPGATPVMRISGFPFIVYTASQIPPAASIAVLVAPGVYVLNVFNLTNEQNILGYSMLTLA